MTTKAAKALQAPENTDRSDRNPRLIPHAAPALETVFAHIPLRKTSLGVLVVTERRARLPAQSRDPAFSRAGRP